MKKNIQIVLLILVFVVCAACGYIFGDIIFNIKEEPVEDVVVEVFEPVVSTIPVIDSITPPVRNGKGYDFVVFASVESNDTLCYHLYGDDSCINEIDKSYTGAFKNIPGTDTEIYYIRVENCKTSEFSEIAGKRDFKKLPKAKQITKGDFEKFFNSKKSWAEAPRSMVDGLAVGYVINCEMRKEERKVSTVGDVCQKMQLGIWDSVEVFDVIHDGDGRVTKLVIKANYPED